jgi:uroporphyrinogen decarboxylase
MTGREVTRMAFELKEPPRLPVSLFAGGAWMVHWAGKTFAEIKEFPEKIADVFIRAFERVGHDYILTGSNFVNYPMHFLGCPIQDDSSDPPALLGTVIKSLKKVDSLSIQRVLRNPTMQGIIRSQHLVADSSARKLFAMTTQWAPLSCAARILGLEAVIEPILEHPDILGVNFADPVASGDMISPQTFRRFAAPFLKELVKRVRAKGKYSMIHICGNTSKILQDLVDIGPNCFSLKKKVDPRRAKEVLGGKVCVAGNVSPTDAFLNGRPEEVVAEAKDCVQAWGKGGASS